MLEEILLIAAGFLALVIGGEVLVRGAVGLAERLRVSTFVIGAAIIGFGSSMPELVTSIEAGLIGAPGIAIGNIVGSNIINILVVLGVAAMIAPIALAGDHVRTDTIIVCALSAAFVALCTALELTPIIGAILLAGLAVYLAYSVRREMNAATGSEAANRDTMMAPIDGPTFTEPSRANRPLLIAAAAVAAGFALLILGGHLVVVSAVSFAKFFGVSETIIGLTVVAFGTSLPEIATAVVAALRRHADIALGNVLGSCVFNLLAIAGTLALLTPVDVPQEIVRFDNLVMLAATALLLIAVCTFRHIGRPVGMVFLAGYAAYLTAIWP